VAATGADLDLDGHFIAGHHDGEEIARHLLEL
jgi:hypothetical protein